MSSTRGGSNGWSRNNGRGQVSGQAKPNGPKTQLIPKYTPPHLPISILGRTPLGWNSSDEMKPPPSKGLGKVKDRNVSLVLNHIPATINPLPKNNGLMVPAFQCYDVDIEIHKPGDLAGEKDLSEKDLSNRMKKMDVSGNGNGSGDKNLVKPALRKKILLYCVNEVEKRESEFENQNCPSPTLLATDGSKLVYALHPITYTDQPFITGQMNAIPGESETSGDTFTATFRPVCPTQTQWDDNCKEFFANMKKYVDSGKVIPAQFTDLTRIYSTALRTQAMKDLIQVGSSNFFQTPANGGFSLGGGLVGFDGLSLTLTMGWKTFVTVDSSFAVFLEGKKVLEALRVLFQGDASNIDDGYWTEEEFRKAEKLLIGYKVFYQSPFGKRKGKPTTAKITGVNRRAAHAITFDIDHKSGKKITTSVAKYFVQGGMRQKFPNGPCLEFQNGKRVVPAEFCTIEMNQLWKGKLTANQTDNMIKVTAKPPTERFKSINESIKSLNLNNNPILKEFGLKPEADLLRIPNARVLPMPTLVYGSDKAGFSCEVTPSQDKGVWNLTSNGANLKFYKPFGDGNTVSYNVVNLASQYQKYPIAEHVARIFLEDLVVKARSAGLNLALAKDAMKKIGGYTELPANPTPGELEEYFRGIDKNVKVVFVILEGDKKSTSNSNSAIYARIKKTETTSNGILTQCIKAVNVSDRIGRGSKIENLIIKLNTKLGGINYLLKGEPNYEAINVLTAPVMMMGADVSHPEAGSKTPSMAAVTGSIDRGGMEYMVHIQAQEVAHRGAAEVIKGIDIIVKKFLKTYFNKNALIPGRIIMYRDGVGDSQFEEVLRTEMMGIRDGCTAFWKEFSNYFLIQKRNKIPGVGEDFAYEPKITFLNAQKRHKTRMFGETSNNSLEKVNPPPGTVIDAEIVNPALTDFYLLSHEAIQGTARSTHYQVVWDDSDFTIDEINKLTYNLCFCFARSMRPVGYPAPTYYAHLGASRGQTYIKDLSVSDFENIDLLNQKIQRNAGLLSQTPMHFI